MTRLHRQTNLCSERWRCGAAVEAWRLSTPPFRSTEEPPGCRSVTAGSSALHFKLRPTGLRLLFLHQLSDPFRHAANPKNSLERQCRQRSLKLSRCEAMLFLLVLPTLRSDSDDSGSGILTIWTQNLPEYYRVGINLNPQHVDIPKNVKYKIVGNRQHLKSTAQRKKFPPQPFCLVM